MTSRNSISLKRRVLKAGVWSLAGHVLSLTIRFGTNLVMTRLLVPEMFGVMAIVTTVITGLAMFSDFGLRQSIVQSKRGQDPHFLNTAWVTQIIRGVILWIVAIGVSLFIALASHMGLVPPGSVYAAPDLPNVIIVSSITAIIAGFESTKLFEASRNLSLNRITSIEIAAQLVGLICMVGWVWIDRSIWALVAGGISSGLVRAVLTHVCLPGERNHWEWETTAFYEIIRFGRWIFLTSILGFLSINGDRLQLGGLVDASVFGVYVIAFLTFSAVEQVITKIISDVSFPALSEIVRVRPKELKTKYYQFRLWSGVFANVISGFLLISGTTVVRAIYDERYAEAGWMLRILAVCLVFTPFQVASQCFLALGRPQILSRLAAIRLMALFTFLPVGFQLGGLPGALWGIVLSRSISLPLVIYYKRKSELLDLRREFLLLPLILLGSALGIALNQIARNL